MVKQDATVLFDLIIDDDWSCIKIRHSLHSSLFKWLVIFGQQGGEEADS